MVYCPACGTANREGSRFCNECGARLISEAAAPCPRCGVTNQLGAAHCQACGFDLARAQRGLAGGSAARPSEPGAADDLGDEGEASAPRDIGLPPWLDSIESEAGSAPRQEAFEDLADLEAERSETRARPGGWSPGAIPIEPVVGVPYRAYERAGLPPAPEQERAAGLFAAAASEEVHAAPHDVPASLRPAGLGVWAQRMLAAALLVALLAPTLWPAAPLSAAPAAPAVAAAAQAIDSLPPGAPVLVAFEYDAGIAGDLQPVAEAYLRDLFGHGARVILVTTRPEGGSLAGMALDQALRAYPSVRVEGSVLRLGYVPGGDAAVRTLATNLSVAAPAGDGSVVAGLSGLGGARDLPLVVVLGGDLTALRRWIEQVGAPYGTPLLAGVPAQVEPAIEPYRAAGQLRGVVAGIAGAAAYEQLDASAGAATRSVAALRVGTWVIAGAVVVANLWGLAAWVRRRRAVREA